MLQADTAEVPELPIRRSNDRLVLRMPLEEIAKRGRMIRFRYPKRRYGLARYQLRGLSRGP